MSLMKGCFSGNGECGFVSDIMGKGSILVLGFMGTVRCGRFLLHFLGIVMMSVFIVTSLTFF